MFQDKFYERRIRLILLSFLDDRKNEQANISFNFDHSFSIGKNWRYFGKVASLRRWICIYRV
jgi:hypothetical protein